MKRHAKFRDAMADIEGRISRLEADRKATDLSRLVDELNSIVVAAKERASAREVDDKSMFESDAIFARELQSVLQRIPQKGGYA